MASTEAVFQDKKTNRGWVLNIVKNNDVMITTSLYDDGGAFIETRAFNLKMDNDIKILRRYIELFEDHPKKNLQKMLRLTLRK